MCKIVFPSVAGKCIISLQMGVAELTSKFGVIITGIKCLWLDV
jgi:hypothetical protein